MHVLLLDCAQQAARSHCESFPARKVALQRGVLERSLIKGVADVEYR